MTGVVRVVVGRGTPVYGVHGVRMKYCVGGGIGDRVMEVGVE